MGCGVVPSADIIVPCKAALADLNTRAGQLVAIKGQGDNPDLRALQMIAVRHNGVNAQEIACLAQESLGYAQVSEKRVRDFQIF